jgi:hypothetical protein
MPDTKDAVRPDGPPEAKQDPAATPEAPPEKKAELADADLDKVSGGFGHASLLQAQKNIGGAVPGDQSRAVVSSVNIGGTIGPIEDLLKR